MYAKRMANKALRWCYGLLWFSAIVLREPNWFHARLAVKDTYWNDWPTAVEYYLQRIDSKYLDHGC